MDPARDKLWGLGQVPFSLWGLTLPICAMEEIALGEDLGFSLVMLALSSLSVLFTFILHCVFLWPLSPSLPGILFLFFISSFLPTSFFWPPSPWLSYWVRLPVSHGLFLDGLLTQPLHSTPALPGTERELQQRPITEARALGWFLLLPWL